MTQALSHSRADASLPQPHLRILCPYCGHLQSGEAQCDQCRGLFEPLSRQATQNSMGPWQLRDLSRPFAPGCSYDTLKQLIARGRVTSTSIIRGPTTRQFWRFAIDAPGVAVLLGRCHACHAAVNTADYMCKACGDLLAPIPALDRQHLNLQPLQSPTDTPPASIPPTPMEPSARADAHRRPAPAVPSAPAGGQLRPRQSIPLAAPGAAAPRSIAAELHIPPQPPQSITRALRREITTLRAALAALAFIILALIVAVVFLMVARSAPPTADHRATLPAAAPTAAPAIDNETRNASERAVPPAAATSPNQSTASISPDPALDPAAPLDPGLSPWTSDITRAAELAAQDTADALAKAVEVLKLVQQQATTSTTQPASHFPNLAARIADYESRLDRLELHNLVNPPPATPAPTP